MKCSVERKSVSDLYRWRMFGLGVGVWHLNLGYFVLSEP